MSEARMMGSLADRLLSFVSTTPERDANYDIAVTLLKHYPQLKGMTLGQIANLCYTSKASISRFCRFLGMDSFKAFQAWLEQDFTMRTDYSRQFYTAAQQSGNGHRFLSRHADQQHLCYHHA